MSYRSYPGQSLSVGAYTNEQFGFAQSYMRDDILALQKMYGADFGLNSGDSVYTWNASTGQMSINGVGQGTPGANRVFLTIWDGGGNDTYDMSNYSTGVTINLEPGMWSVTSAAQKALLGTGHYAQGNVYNAYQYDGDVRSLIENAIGGSGNDGISGNAADNWLDGRDGNDTLYGMGGSDRLDGGNGNDTLNGWTENDFLYGGNGDDRLIGDAGSDQLQGENGNDSLNGGDGNDWLVGGDGDDVLDGGKGNNYLDGGSGNDTLTAGTGDDFFVVHDDGSADVINGFGSGENINGVIHWAKDQINFGFTYVRSFEQLMTFATEKPYILYNVVLGTSVVFNFGAAGSLTLNQTLISKLTADEFVFSNPEQPSTVAPSDITLSSTVVSENAPGAQIGALTVSDLDGDTSFTFVLSDARFEVTFDLVDGYALKLKNGIQLDNEVDPSIALDITAIDPGGFSFQKQINLQVLEGPGVVIGGTLGNDLVDATHTVAGYQLPTDDSDTISGEAGNDTIYGLRGNDLIYGGLGNDFLYGGAGNDWFYGGPGADHIEGGDGDDSFLIALDEGLNDEILGGAGNDTLNLSGASVTLAGFGPGNSIEIFGGSVIGTSAANVFDFSGITAENGLIYVDAGAANDTLIGSVFADELRGGVGNDSISGGDGNDLLYGQAGVDYLDGGAGNDRITIAGSEAISDTMLGGAGIDVIVAEGTAPVVLTGFGPGNSIEIFNSGGLGVLGTKAANVFDFSGLVSNEILYVDAGAGNDTLIGGGDLRGGAGNDLISGGTGPDSLYGGAGVDNIDGGAGNDTIYITGVEASLDTMQGGDGFDTIWVLGTKAVTLSGFSAANSIESWVGNNAAVIGTSANNILDFSGVTTNQSILYVDGGNGNDTIIGTAFADDLRGGGGNDILNGGAGNDMLNGGKGADTFIFSGNFGIDTIAVGFTAGVVTGHDIIQFDIAQFADFAAVTAHAAQVGTSVVITLDANNSVTLQSMTVAKLVAADFTFV